MAMKWSKEIQWNEIAPAAVVLGIVPDCSVGSMHKVSDMLKERMDKGLVRKRKEGTAQTASTWYQGLYEITEPDQLADVA
jgi:hypothetical protein